MLEAMIEIGEILLKDSDIVKESIKSSNQNQKK